MPAAKTITRRAPESSNHSWFLDRVRELAGVEPHQSGAFRFPRMDLLPEDKTSDLSNRLDRVRQVLQVHTVH